MNSSINAVWMNIGIALAAIIFGGLMFLMLAIHLKGAAASIASSIRKTPVRALLVGLALGVLVSYAGTKPPVPQTTYTVKFELPLAFETIGDMECDPGVVYQLPTLDGYLWESSANGRLYDGGLLIFDLAKPGETVTMKAMGE